jgi:hypothetical protein
MQAVFLFSLPQKLEKKKKKKKLVAQLGVSGLKSFRSDFY